MNTMKQREIKFRAWENGGMHYDLAYITMSGGAMGPERPLIRPILMQFTGLKDKHGKDFYERDIFRHPNVPEPMMVVWDERTAGFAITKKGWMFPHFFHEAVDPAECEIIGNIYEHPELLSK